jgi:lysozyme
MAAISVATPKIKVGSMISRRTALAGLAGLTLPAMAGCAVRRPQPAASFAPGYDASGSDASSSAYPASGDDSPPVTGGSAARPGVIGLDAVIDISHNVTVSDFNAVRHRSAMLGVIHKATEGGDYLDQSYSERRPQAEAAGLLWGAYHFGTRMHSGVQQAQFFLAVARPQRDTLMALDFEPNDGNPRNTMTLAQAEAFVLTVYRATGRLPLVYTRPSFANGERSGRGRLSLGQPIGSGSILARCDLWLADYHEQPELPYAWADRGWRFWQYAGDDTEDKAAYGSTPRTVIGVSHCDRNLFAGDSRELYGYWRGPSRGA